METPKKTKMILVSTKIAEPFHNFLKEYLAFFGSGMTVEDLIQQIVYEESRRLHDELTAFVEIDTHYVGKHPWFKKFQYVAETTGNWPDKEDVDVAEETSPQEA